MKTPFILAVLLLCLIFESCKKDVGPSVIPINQQMAKDLGFNTGSYWIYRDSATNQLDSAYVYDKTIETAQLGCVSISGAPQCSMEKVFIKIGNTTATDSETIILFMRDTVCQMSWSYVHDTTVISNSFPLFFYPIKVGPTPNISSCVMGIDSALVSDIVASYCLNGQTFANTARSVHNLSMFSGTYLYSDHFYICPRVGFVKLVFNHPGNGLHRVLELVRYHVQ